MQLFLYCCGNISTLTFKKAVEYSITLIHVTHGCLVSFVRREARSLAACGSGSALENAQCLGWVVLWTAPGCPLLPDVDLGLCGMFPLLR